MSGPAVTSTAVLAIRRQFGVEVLEICETVAQLVEARQETIEKLRASAAYLDSVWLREGLINISSVT